MWTGAEVTGRPRIFIGSSTLNLKVARALADCLEDCDFRPLVWDEGLLQQNKSIFDGLLHLSKEVEFAVFIWEASDVTITDGPLFLRLATMCCLKPVYFWGPLANEVMVVTAAHRSRSRLILRA
jgi:hypothetical protein